MRKRQARHGFVIVRVNDAERNQVDALAQAMKTTPSGALRKLVDQAVKTLVIDNGADCSQARGAAVTYRTA